jgi:hypothetical protein
VTPVPWLQHYAAGKGLRYHPDPDERWLRAWEPFATLRTPNRYEHALEATWDVGSLTVARLVVPVRAVGPEGPYEAEARAWIAIAQDERLRGTAASTCDVGRVFGEPLNLVPLPRRRTGDPAFDHVFASFAPSPEDLARAITPSLRRLLLSWRTPVHMEVRPGGFIVAPVGLAFDVPSLGWLLRAVPLFAEKAAKSPSGARARVP